MAIDDVVSSYNNSLANGANLSIQPTSGDEWLMTSAFTRDASDIHLYPHTSDGAATTGLWGGRTTANAALSLGMGYSTIQLLLTNSEYVRINNSSGGTKVVGYSAIKTKE